MSQRKKNEQKMSFYEFKESLGVKEPEEEAPRAQSGSYQSGSYQRRYDGPRDGEGSEEGGRRNYGDRKPYIRNREPRAQPDFNAWSDKGYGWGPQEGEDGEKKGHWDNVSRRKPREDGGKFRPFNKENQEGESTQEQGEGESQDKPERRPWGGERRYPPRDNQGEGQGGERRSFSKWGAPRREEGTSWGEKSDTPTEGQEGEPRQERKSWGGDRRYPPRDNQGEGQSGERRSFSKWGDKPRRDDNGSWGEKTGFPDYKDRKPFEKKDNEESKDRSSVYDSYKKSEKPAEDATTEDKEPNAEQEKTEGRPHFRKDGGSFRGNRGGFRGRDENDKGLLQSSKKKYDVSWGESSGEHWQKPKPKPEGEEGSQTKEGEQRTERHERGERSERGGDRPYRGGRGGGYRGGFKNGPRKHHPQNEEEEQQQQAPVVQQEKTTVEKNIYSALNAEDQTDE